jgi:diaminobutyrate-2-oxoglutarate transaminase
MKIIERLESEVRSYVRSFPTVFARAEGAHLIDCDGRDYLDFFAGAGALNYGHNNPRLTAPLIEYISKNGVAHGLDMATEAKCRFLETLERCVLRPRDLRYKVMFPGPTGTNAVEAAIKLARKATGRTNVVAFTNAFHGMTLGALALTANGGKRAGAGVALTNTTRVPFDGYFGPEVDTLEHLETMLTDSSSGVDAPAAFIVETVQAEGGINVASEAWLLGLQQLAHEHGALLIVDDIQVGCGRTGPFFSFEEAGLTPDIVCLSKSLSGLGLPLAITLFRPELDLWSPGEHNGTFRGNNHAFVTAAAALDNYWRDDVLAEEVDDKAELICSRLSQIAEACGAEVRGRGLLQGLAFAEPATARAAAAEAFSHGLIIETAGADDEVLKLLPPLTIDGAELRQGLDIIAEAVERVAEAGPANANGCNGHAREPLS